MRGGEPSTVSREWAPSATIVQRAAISRPSRLTTPATRSPSQRSVCAVNPPTNSTPSARARSSSVRSSVRRRQTTAAADSPPETTASRPPGVTSRSPVTR